MALVKHITSLVPWYHINVYRLSHFENVATKRYPSEIFVEWNKRMGTKSGQGKMRYIYCTSTWLSYLITCHSEHIINREFSQQHTILLKLSSYFILLQSCIAIFIIHLWHSVEYRFRGNTLYINIPFVPQALVRCDVVCCQGILV